MRVWDINPGYLNRQSLLGEHREIHALFSIIAHGKRGYAHHPETLRWQGKLAALKQRHDLVVSEMELRGYRHHSPVTVPGAIIWPETFVDPPGEQFAILRRKYAERAAGRIPLPQTVKNLWRQHELSLLARDPPLGLREGVSFEQLAHELVEMLRRPPSDPRLTCALDRIWAHLNGEPPPDPVEWIAAARRLAVEQQARPLLESTALSDLHTWIAQVHGGSE